MIVLWEEQETFSEERTPYRMLQWYLVDCAWVFLKMMNMKSRPEIKKGILKREHHFLPECTKRTNTRRISIQTRKEKHLSFTSLTQLKSLMTQLSSQLLSIQSMKTLKWGTSPSSSLHKRVRKRKSVKTRRIKRKKQPPTLKIKNLMKIPKLLSLMKYILESIPPLMGILMLLLTRKSLMII